MVCGVSTHEQGLPDGSWGPAFGFNNQLLQDAIAKMLSGAAVGKGLNVSRRITRWKVVLSTFCMVELPESLNATYLGWWPVAAKTACRRASSGEGEVSQERRTFWLRAFRPASWMTSEVLLTAPILVYQLA